MLDYCMLVHPPSVVAAAALVLANSYDSVFRVTSPLQRLSGYTPQILGELLRVKGMLARIS